MQGVHCAACDAEITLAHLAECLSPTGVRFRVELRRDILLLLSADARAAPWLRASRRLQLLALLLSLFPFAASSPPAEQYRHLTRLMCGAFSRHQESAAAKSLGFLTAEEGRDTLRQLRVLCLEHIQRVYSALKAAAVP